LDFQRRLLVPDHNRLLLTVYKGRRGNDIRSSIKQKAGKPIALIGSERALTKSGLLAVYAITEACPSSKTSGFWGLEFQMGAARAVG
jgi:hypothetical protein